MKSVVKKSLILRKNLPFEWFVVKKNSGNSVPGTQQAFFAPLGTSSEPEWAKLLGTWYASIRYFFSFFAMLSLKCLAASTVSCLVIVLSCACKTAIALSTTSSAVTFPDFFEALIAASAT